MPVATSSGAHRSCQVGKTGRYDSKTTMSWRTAAQHDGLGKVRVVTAPERDLLQAPFSARMHMNSQRQASDPAKRQRILSGLMPATATGSLKKGFSFRRNRFRAASFLVNTWPLGGFVPSLR